MKNTNLYFIESLGHLYEDVQLSKLFSDSKFFVDSVPKFPVEEILIEYDKLKNTSDFILKDFVEKYFILPKENISQYSSAKKSIGQHLNDLWDELTRIPDEADGTLIPLPHPYIVPGGRFREIYYWDSYFTMLGLQVSKRIDMIQHMVDNFSYLIDTVGFIPNGNRTYYLGRSQPPFFALMVKLLAEENGEDIFMKYHHTLEKEYGFWMNGEEVLWINNIAVDHVVLLDDLSILNRYWDAKNYPRPEAFIEDEEVARLSKNAAEETYQHIRAAAESGWDFSSRWFKDGELMHTIQTTHLIPVDLNCLILFLEQTLLNNYKQKNDESKIKAFKIKIDKRIKAIQSFCWNGEEGCFFDYHFIDKVQVKHFNLSMMFPLFFKIATQEQADKIAAIIETKFLYPGGLTTTIYETAQQWDAPNGWAPLQWISIMGLKNYGHNKLAEDIAERWLSLNENVFNTTGKMMEKYNVNDLSKIAGGGEYPSQDGFGWTNGVYLALKEMMKR